MQTLQELQANWKDDAQSHKALNELFTDKTNAVPELKRHRDYVEQHVWGFGERSFLWMWWLLVKEMPQEFTFLEIGVFRGQILSLIRLIADMQGKNVTRYGVTPLSRASDRGEANNWESDYRRDIEIIHEQLEIEQDYTILHGFSWDENILAEVRKLKIDLLFVDGAHDYESVLGDYQNYTPQVTKGGFVVCDDACNDLKLWFGAFPGQQSCTDATVRFFKDNPAFEFVGNVMHDRIYRCV